MGKWMAHKRVNKDIGPTRRSKTGGEGGRSEAQGERREKRETFIFHSTPGDNGRELKRSTGLA